MNRQRVTFQSAGADALRLEGVLALPETGEVKPPAALLCHPHPMGGGSMDAGLLLSLESAVTAAGIATLRFNFRGVDGSEGVSTDGVLETEDVEGACRFLASRSELDSSRLFLAGWSFGSWVGFRWVLETGRAQRAALVSPPTAMYDFFENLPAGEPPSFETLIIAGDRDQFAGPADLKRLAGLTGADLKLLRGADHFLFGHEREIAREVTDFFM